MNCPLSTPFIQPVHDSHTCSDKIHEHCHHILDFSLNPKHLHIQRLVLRVLGLGLRFVRHVNFQQDDRFMDNM